MKSAEKTWHFIRVAHQRNGEGSHDGEGNQGEEVVHHVAGTELESVNCLSWSADVFRSEE